MIIRLFKNEDAIKVSKLVAKTMMTSNINDYPKEYLMADIKERTPYFFIEISKLMHCYVYINNKGEIVGTGSIGPYWGKNNESSLFNIFVNPDYQGLGIGKKIIKTLEEDEYFCRADRIEIPSSITGLKFYLKIGYKFKNSNNKIDDENLYRLEKFNYKIKKPLNE